MAIVVEHDKRVREILAKSLDVFADEGYEDVTFQKIADRCGITRTTLYIYFNNKREIFLGSLKQLLSDMEISLKEIINNKDLTSEQQIRMMMETIIDHCEENIKMFDVLLNYLSQMKKAGVDPNEKVRRRVVRLRHLMSTVIIRGIQNKEFKEINVHIINELLYGLVESAIFRITVLNQADISEVKTIINQSIDGILLK
ncbi:MAG: TetR/AcrR family transcriptional regulator [Treponema sp.]|nr:TetR/AcrR family transcriptional regulator [Treponema sp.]